MVSLLMLNLMVMMKIVAENEKFRGASNGKDNIARLKIMFFSLQWR